jgi:hypothetical protein
MDEEEQAEAIANRIQPLPNGSLFQGRRGNFTMSRGDNRYQPRGEIAEKGVKKVWRLPRGANHLRTENYVKENRYAEWNRYVEAQNDHQRAHPNATPVHYEHIPFDQFTVEKRASDDDPNPTIVPLKRHVTYQPTQPVKSHRNGCKYGKYSAGGHIFCFRNPNHHKLSAADDPDPSKQRGRRGGNRNIRYTRDARGNITSRTEVPITAAQREAYRRRRGTVGLAGPAPQDDEEVEEEAAEPERIRGRGGMRRPSQIPQPTRRRSPRLNP